ncbi:MAG: peptidylprolyl isomerase [Bacteroidota bacterium]
MKRIFGLMVFGGLFFGMAQAQTESKVVPFVFSIDKEKVYADEFERQYLKNINLKEDAVTSKDIRNYLDLYIKFKLKVQDAKDAGLDTVTAYVQELQMYRDQLARNYLYDRSVTDALVKEAYDRLQNEVKVSHILILCSTDVSDADQKKVLEKIENIHRMLMRNPTAINFGDIARTESEDVGTKSAGGDLGWMTALQVVYEFENQAYNTSAGGISPVFKTEFGYHILMVNDKRANRGDIKVNHILVRVMNKEESSDTEARKKIDEIALNINSGKETFENMARTYSEDYNSRYNGGAMDYINVTQFVGDIDRQYWADQAFSMKKDGDITAPFRTNYGWHLLQRVNVRPLRSFEDKEMRSILKMDVQKNQRSQISVDSLVVKIKKENGFKLNNSAVDAVVSYLDSNFMKGKFDEASMPEFHKVTKMEGKKKVITEYNLRKMEVFKLGESSYSVADLFTQFTYSNKPVVGTKKDGVTRIMNEWIDKTCVEYQNDHLEEKSVEFRDIYQEYKEGILMFNRMQQLVWDRANNDTAGLKVYFGEHQREYNWNNRFDVAVYFCNDAKMMKTVAKQVKKGISADSLRREHTKKNILDFSYRTGKFELSDTFLFSPSPILKMLFADLSAEKPKYNKAGIYQVGQVGDDFVVVKVNAFLPAGPKTLDETRGPVASKYQEQLEREWIESLKNRYALTVNESAVQAIEAKLVNKK